MITLACDCIRMMQWMIWLSMAGFFILWLGCLLCHWIAKTLNWDNHDGMEHFEDL